MLSLLLTLFISLFSICPSNYQVEDHCENNNILMVDDNLKPKQSFTDRYGYTYIGLSEFGDYYFYQAFMALAASNGTIGNSSTTFDQYRNGTAVYFSNMNITLGTLDNGNFTAIRNISDISCYHTYINDYATRTTWTFYSASGSADYVVRGFFYFNDLTLLNCINNEREVLGTTTQPFGEWNICLRWLYSDYSTLFPYFSSDMNQYNTGYENGYAIGNSKGYQEGYNDGYTEGASSDSTASTIFTGILDVSLIPVNVFLTIFNFEVFGINIGGIVSALLTISVVVIIIRFVTGKKDD